MAAHNIDCTVDCIIIGGGPVGALLAYVLKKFNFTYLMAEAYSVEDLYNKDNLAIALNQSSVNILQNLNLWNNIAENSTKINNIHISYGSHISKFNSNVHNNIATVVPMLKFKQALYNNILDDSNCYFNTTVINLNKVADDSPYCWYAELNNAQKVQGKILVIADGHKSQMRSHIGIGHHTAQCNEQAILADLILPHSHHNTAYEYITHNGIIAVIPYAINRMKFIWTLQNTNANYTEHELYNIIKPILQNKIHSFNIENIIVRNLELSQAFCLQQDQAILLGNAARFMHPIAAPGLNLAIRDVAALLECLLTAKQYGAHLNSPGVLKDYANWRNQDHKITQTFSDLLHKILASGDNLLGNIITVGSIYCSNIIAIQELILKIATSSMIRLPQLAYLH